MLNYIWIALIVIGILAAIGGDLVDERQNPFRNGLALEATLEVQKTPSPHRESWEGVLVLPAPVFNEFYGREATDTDLRQPVAVSVSATGASSAVFPVGDATPPFWKEMARSSSGKDRLAATVESFRVSDDRCSAQIRFVMEPIHFTRMKAVTQAALDYASTAVTIAIGLIGIMALWLGVMKVAEEAGLLRILTRALTPITRRLFPDVPPDHPAVSAMIMNIAANMLGLSNAATPMGLKAMEELNKLNPRVGTATNAMVTFLAINTGGLILIPATAMAVRAASGSANAGIIIGTSIVGASCATVAGVVASKLLQRLPRYKKAMEVSHD